MRRPENSTRRHACGSSYSSYSFEDTVVVGEGDRPDQTSQSVTSNLALFENCISQLHYSNQMAYPLQSYIYNIRTWTGVYYTSLDRKHLHRWSMRCLTNNSPTRVHPHIYSLNCIYRPSRPGRLLSAGVVVVGSGVSNPITGLTSTTLISFAKVRCLRYISHYSFPISMYKKVHISPPQV